MFQFRPTIRSLPLLVFSLFGPATSTAASGPPDVSTVLLSGLTDAGGEVRLNVMVQFGSELDPGIVGLDVYRTVLGECVRARITEELLPLPQPGIYEFQAFDRIDPDSIYRYEVFAVDEERRLKLVNTFEAGRREWYAHSGEENIVGMGQLLTLGPQALFVPCPDSCWRPLLAVRALHLEEFIDTGANVALRGVVNCEDPAGCVAVVSAEPTSCTPVLAVETATWGAIKARY